MMEWVEGFLKKHKRQQAMLGKKFLLTPDSAYRKRPIAKSHNGRERRCAIPLRQFARNLSAGINTTKDKKGIVKCGAMAKLLVRSWMISRPCLLVQSYIQRVELNTSSK